VQQRVVPVCASLDSRLFLGSLSVMEALTVHSYCAEDLHIIAVPQMKGILKQAQLIERIKWIRLVRQDAESTKQKHFH
jgi:hypothetical protein